MSRFPHKYPKGYKQFKVMEAMVAKHGLTYTEIIKLAYELTHGKGSFDLDSNRGYWSGAFVYKTKGFYGSNVNGWITKYCEKAKDGKYYLVDRDVYAKLQEKFANLKPEVAAARHFENHPENEPLPQDRVEAFRERYAEPLANFEQRQAEKFERVTCSNGLVLDTTGSVPEVPMRGIKLDDEVIYYRKRNGQTGDAYIQSVKETSRRLANPRFEISLGLDGSSIPQLSYDEEKDTFFEMGGFEVQIIKKTL